MPECSLTEPIAWLYSCFYHWLHTVLNIFFLNPDRLVPSKGSQGLSSLYLLTVHWLDPHIFSQQCKRGSDKTLGQEGKPSLPVQQLTSRTCLTPSWSEENLLCESLVNVCWGRDSGCVQAAGGQVAHSLVPLRGVDHTRAHMNRVLRKDIVEWSCDVIHSFMWEKRKLGLHTESSNCSCCCRDYCCIEEGSQNVLSALHMRQSSASPQRSSLLTTAGGLHPHGNRATNTSP